MEAAPHERKIIERNSSKLVTRDVDTPLHIYLLKKRKKLKSILIEMRAE